MKKKTFLCFRRIKRQRNLYLLPVVSCRPFLQNLPGSCRCSHSAKNSLIILLLPSPSTFKAKPLAAADAAMVQKPLWAKSVVYVIKYRRYIRQIVWPFFSISYSTSVYRGPLPPGSVLGREERADVGLGFWVWVEVRVWRGRVAAER